MKIWITYLFICAFVFSAVSLKIPPQSETKNNAISFSVCAYFKKEVVGFSASAKILKADIAKINKNDLSTIMQSKIALKDCRLCYKRFSFLLDYFFQSEATVFNAPPKYEIEEPFMEYQHPKGLQVIESLLFDVDPAAQRKALIQQSELVEKSAADLSSLLYNFQPTDDQLLESIQIELIRLMTLYITGYDAPFLKSGIEESLQSLNGFSVVLSNYQQNNNGVDSINYFLSGAIHFLKTKDDFYSFDRLKFLTNYALPLQEQLEKLAREKKLQRNSATALNKNAINLFSADALSKKAFPLSKEYADSFIGNIGKELFFDKDLSAGQKRSCGFCHSPEKYFTDGMVRNISLDGKHNLARNTMSLLYSCYQYSQFWDGSANSLEDQIKTVLNNKDEMGVDDSELVSIIKSKNLYAINFKRAWPADIEPINARNITNAIASYVRTLAPFNSAFDKYMQGKRDALNDDEKSGFNLFMGKAQCGTCHFAPLFNGLIPPLYNRTEYEVLGTPVNDNFKKIISDTDQGRYSFYKISFYKSAFKTPTIRNAAKTAPYMHNGGFKSLQSVIEFYNKGGGNGLGLHIPNQTLSSNSLGLTAKEKNQIVEFINSLTDEIK